MSNRSVTSFKNSEALASGVARALVQTISRMQRNGPTSSDDGLVRLVLTGGTVGVKTLRQLLVLDHSARASAEDFPVAAIDWNRVLVFFGDERFLPAGDEERNDVQARAALLDHIEIPRSNIFTYATVQEGQAADGESLDKAADSYAHVLQREAPNGFDIHLLGMGPEGHVNSLFPHTEELMDPQGTVAAVRNCPKPPSNRVSLTRPAVNSSRQVWFIINDEAKKEAAQHALAADSSGQWPAGMMEGTEETILWVDAEADPQS